MRGKPWVPLVALLWTLASAGCVKDTLAQQIAYAHWTKCQQHHPGVRLQHIEPNGQIWFFYTAPTQAYEARTCMNRVAWEEARRLAAVSPAAGQAAAEEPPLGEVHPPVWKRGYEWAYRFEVRDTGGLLVWAVEGQRAIDGVPHWIVRALDREIFFRVRDLAHAREDVNGTVEFRSIPPRTMEWPLRIGREWEQRYTLEFPTQKRTQKVLSSVRVDAEETVIVPAGAFRSMRVVVRDKRTGRLMGEYWYAPRAMQFVKMREPAGNDTLTRELIDYRLN